MTLDTKSIYLGIPPYFISLQGPFVIVRLKKIYGCVEIKLLNKKHKDFQSNSMYVTTPGHAHVTVRAIEKCSKITNMTDFIKHMCVTND